MYIDSYIISSESRDAKHILFIAQKVVSVEVINNLFLDHRFKDFVDATAD